MNVRAIDPTSAALVTQQVAASGPPAKKASPAAAISGVPATVKPEDRALYMQILKSVGGNVNLALAALAAKEASEAAS